MANDDGIIERTPLTVIANEFTAIEVAVAQTPTGQRLELRDARSRTSILLDPMQLEILTKQRPEAFTELFRRDLDAT